ncbi:hypothetical protein [Segeticoccus rhizosphaerae]|uniref:hypothetical protein n=1 Tax=Segeticoccus rhizosphaerae TaxID=1104777 RepID=UPI0012653AE7|nr:hypothetical protein [Segeticoccus rhizosphaerae]
MRLVIHSGAHKTGTTLIQDVLAACEGQMPAEGIRYIPYTELTPHRVLSYLHPKALDSSLREDVESFFGSVARSAEYDTVVLSAESLFSYSNLWMRPPERFFYGDIQHSAARMADLCSFDEVDVILYLRRQDTFVNSIYVEHVKSGVLGVPFRSFYDQLELELLSWSRIVATLVDAFGRGHLHVRVFESLAELGPRRFVEDFLEVAKLSCQVPDIDLGKSNRNLSRGALERALKAFPGMSLPERRAYGRMLQLQERAVLNHQSARLITPTQQRGVLRPHEQDNARLLADFGIDPSLWD